MSDVNVKLTAPADPRLYEQQSSSYLLNVEVLENLKQAIRDAKDAGSTDRENTQK
jgi:hypothetical protein